MDSNNVLIHGDEESWIKQSIPDQTAFIIVRFSSTTVIVLCCEPKIFPFQSGLHPSL